MTTLIAAVLVQSLASGAASERAAHAAPVVSATAPLAVRAREPSAPDESDVLRAMREVVAANGLPSVAAPALVPRLAACFEAGTVVTPEMLESVERMMRARLGPFADRYNLVSAWGGAGVTVTWSLMPDGVVIPNAGYAGESAGPSTLFASMDSAFPSREVWIGLIQSCFDRWQAVSGIQFVRVTSAGNEWDDGAAFWSAGTSARGDIRIGMKGIGPNILAYAYYPGVGDVTLDVADLVSFANPAGNYRYFRNTFQHELGHSIGLAHSCPQNGTKIMEPSINDGFDGVRHDEIRGVQALYGDFYEPNNAALDAPSLGSLAPGAAFSLGGVPAPSVSNGSVMGLSENGDVDFYRVTFSVPTLLSGTVSPVGLTHPLSEQVSGACNPGVNVNSTLIQRLAFQLLRMDQSVVGTSSGTPNSTLTRKLIPAGEYLLRVYATTPSSTADESQLYSLSGNATRASVTASANVVRRIDVSWATALAGATYDVYRMPVSMPGAEAQIAAAASGTSLQDVDVVPGVTYQYRVMGTQPGATPVQYEFGTGLALAGTCPADFNSDGQVDDADFVLFASAYDALEVPPANPLCDLTADLLVDDADFTVFVSGYDGLVCP